MYYRFQRIRRIRTVYKITIFRHGGRLPRSFHSNVKHTHNIVGHNLAHKKRVRLRPSDAVVL
jgi:hypothetical protein